MNNVEDIPDFVFQRALVSASGVNILNLCSFLILNNFICFNKMVLRLGVGGRKQDKAFNMPFVSFNMLSTKNFGSVDLINKEFIISHSKKSKYKTVPGLIDLAAHWHHKDSGSFPFFVQLSSAESLQPQANGNQFLGALFLSQWPDIDWKLFLLILSMCSTFPRSTPTDSLSSHWPELYPIPCLQQSLARGKRPLWLHLTDGCHMRLPIPTSSSHPLTSLLQPLLTKGI